MNSSSFPSDVISVSDLGWDVGGRSILDAISFSVLSGQFVGLIGPNGAGKSSLLRCLYRVNQPTRGSVCIDGHDIWHSSLKENAKKVAVILQENGDYFGLSVTDVVAMGLTPHKSLFAGDSADDRQQVKSALAQVGLSKFARSAFANLSGGEKQRVMVARAIVQRPQVLLMDEPTNHLDVHYQIEVLQLAKSLGITVLASIHDLNLAAAFCDSILLLDEGRLVSAGSPQEVLTECNLKQHFRTQAIVDQHPTSGCPRISYDYHHDLIQSQAEQKCGDDPQDQGVEQ